MTRTRLGLSTRDYRRVGGYDERIMGYGWDDSNMHLRLDALPLRRVDLDMDYIEHIPHPPHLRTSKGTQATFHLPADAITQKNRVLSEAAPLWNASFASSTTRVLEESDGYDDGGRPFGRRACMSGGLVPDSTFSRAQTNTNGEDPPPPLFCADCAPLFCALPPSCVYSLSFVRTPPPPQLCVSAAYVLPCVSPPPPPPLFVYIGPSTSAERGQCTQVPGANQRCT